MKRSILIALLACGLWGCGKTTTPAAGQQATVTLNDGSTFSGTVTGDSTTSISLQAASGESRTYPKSQVTSVQYGSAAPVASNTSPGTTLNPGSSLAPSAPAPAPAPSQPVPSQPAPLSSQNVPPPPPVRSDPAPAPAPVRPVAEFRTIPAGTTLEVRNDTTIDSESADVGQTYSGTVVRPVVDTDGRVVVPQGSNATLVVRSASGQGKLQGRSDLAVDVGSVEVGGRHYRMETSDYVEKGRDGLGKNKRTGEFIGGGAALGGIIGAIAGGGKGAAIGALSGAGAGTVTQGVTRGKAVRIPAETVLTFRLEAPVRVREVR